MVSPEQVKQYLSEGLPCDYLDVVGDGAHFEAVIVSSEFVGKNRVQRHQRVYQALGNRMDTGEVHALSMKTFTPEEWEKN